MEQAADQDLTLLATDLADILVKEGLPFRQAHEVVGEVVRYSIEREKRIQDLTDRELHQFSKLFPKGTSENLSAHHSVHQKTAIGGTSPKNVEAQAALLKQQVALIKKHISELRG